MSAVTSTNALAKDSTLQDVADAISTMGATSVGNLSALTTTDKTSLVGAVNEVKSGLTGLSNTLSQIINVNPIDTGHRVMIQDETGTYLIQFEFIESGSGEGRLYATLKINNQIVYQKYFTPSN